MAKIDMDRQGKSVKGTTVVSPKAVLKALTVSTVEATEEKVIRMRHGASVALDAPLPTVHGGNEALEDELMLLEFQLFKAMKAKAMAAKAGPSSTVKSKIVGALGRKKP